MQKSFQRINLSLFFLLFLLSVGCSKKNAELLLSEPEGVYESTESDSVYSEEQPENDMNKEETAGTSDSDAKEPEEEQTLMVHVCGAVGTEGVYELSAGSRVIDAVTAAGGFSDDADSSYINQAMILEDGIKLRIPTLEETMALAGGDDKGADPSGADNISGDNDIGISGGDCDSKESDNGAVNINTASESELCEIPGIGPSKAKSIIAYREENGKYVTIEDIMKVSGIKEKFFAKIKEHITV